MRPLLSAIDRVLTAVDRVLTRAGVKITAGVATMWCAGAFTVLSLVALPAAVASRNPVILVSWLSQSFLQLVLLSILAVQQRIEGARTEARDQETHDAVLAEHAETRQILTEVHALVAEMHPHVTGEAAA